MKKETARTFFALLRSAVFGSKLGEAELGQFNNEQFPELLKMSIKHDVAHLLVLGLKQNGLISQGETQKIIYKAVLRCERLKYEYEKVCAALEDAKIQFVPLKGSVLRKLYPEEWMRTSCDIDILVRKENLEEAVCCLSEKLQYTESERGPHDVGFDSPSGVRVELHFDLVAEGKAKNAADILKNVWDDVSLCDGCNYQYQMSDALFYFYHIAHMAKHFENGGCGLRPFIDMKILDSIEDADVNARNKILDKGGLLRFAEVSRKLSNVWFSNEEDDEFSRKLTDFILHGGSFGTSENRVALQQKKNGGRVGYILSRVFLSYDRLKRYYPVLEKHKWLMPVMQIRRWFMLLNPIVMRMAKNEISANNSVDKSLADNMNELLRNVGL